MRTTLSTIQLFLFNENNFKRVIHLFINHNYTYNKIWLAITVLTSALTGQCNRTVHTTCTRRLCSKKN